MDSAFHTAEDSARSLADQAGVFNVLRHQLDVCVVGGRQNRGGLEFGELT